jgi:signal transduction histidine kinase
MRRLLDLIAPDEETAERQPQSGIDRLPALIENARSAGLEVTWNEGGDARPVPPGVDLSAYRIVQEALTNAAKHAGACRAQVALNWLPEALEIEVVNDAESAAAPNGSGGRGLIGMRERAELVCGRLEAGPCEGGRYRVWARLPLERAP